MAYSEDIHEAACPKCGTVNHVVVAYAGDYRANERESVACFDCGAHLETEKCWAIYSGPTPEAALVPLRKLQNRA